MSDFESNVAYSEDSRFIRESDMAPEDVPYGEAAFPRAQTTVEAITNRGFNELSRAERVAALTALQDAIKTQLDLEKAGIIENLAGATESQKIPTPMGSLSYSPGKVAVVIDDAKLLEYVRHIHPEAITVETREVIDHDLRAALVKDVVNVGDGDFARGSTGEEITFASLGERASASVAWPASQAQKAAKARARAALVEHLSMLAAPLITQIDGAQS